MNMSLPKTQENTTYKINSSNEPFEDETEKAKKMLGNKVEEMSEEQLSEMVSETKYLVQSWLDDFEKIMFEGKTLQDLLFEGNRKP